MTTKQHISIVLLIAIMLTAGLITIFFFWFYKNLGILTIVESKPLKPVDVIFSFAGGESRLKWATQLHEKFPESLWVISCKDTSDANKINLQYNVDTTRVDYMFGYTNTFEEVKAFKQWKKHKNLRKLTVGLISDPWHMRRIQVITAGLWAWQSIKRRYYPVPDSIYPIKRTTLKNWKSDEKIRKQIERAWLETGYDFIRTFLPFIDSEKLYRKWRRNNS